MSRSFLVPILLPADPVVSLEAATKQYVDNNRTSAGRIFYLSNDTSDIATYFKALDAPSTGAEATFVATVSGTTDFLLAAWATEPGEPGVLVYPAGTAYRRFYVALAGGNTARLHMQIYIRDLAGTETLARDEFSPNFTNTTVALNEWLVSASSVGSMATTDRIVCKLYAQRVSGAGSFAVTLYVEGTTHASHIQTTIVGGNTGAATSLDGLSDVTVATPTDGQVLTYNSGTSQWGNAAPGSVVGTKLSALAAITGALLATLDLIEVVDVSDTTMAASGTNKKITIAELVVYLNTQFPTIAYVDDRANSGPMFGFLFDTTTTAGTSTNGLRINNATPASATAVYVNYTSRSGVDLKTRLLAGTAGDRIYIQDRANSANYRIYELTGAPTDNTTYATVPVVHRTGGGSLWANGAAIVAGFAPPAITIGTTAPSSPLTNDIWIDTT